MLCGQLQVFWGLLFRVGWIHRAMVSVLGILGLLSTGGFNVQATNLLNRNHLFHFLCSTNPNLNVFDFFLILLVILEPSDLNLNFEDSQINLNSQCI